jgi:hypothetical protein
LSFFFVVAVVLCLSRCCYSATLRCRITECSMNEGNQHFCIRVATASGESECVRTEGIFVVNHALILAADLAWAEEWYKDEGGRDKCIGMGVELRDASGGLVATRKVPLKVTLIYQTGAPVGRQDILKLSTGAEGGLGSLLLAQGRAEVRARIDEVSRSHQGWAFRLKIGPDVANNPLDNDISTVNDTAV